MSIRTAASHFSGFLRGARDGLVDTVNPMPFTTDAQGHRKAKVPGLLKTVLWGALGATATVLLALHPATFPAAAVLAAKLGLTTLGSGLLAGLGLRTATSVIGRGIEGGVGGKGLGGTGGAIAGANID